jgi:hypothetical protein
MASTYTGLGTELMTTGENAATWGTKTNTNLKIIEQFAGGYIEQAVTTTTTLSVSDGAVDATLAHRIIKFTGTISANATVTIPLDVQNLYILKNGTSGAYTVTFKYVSGSGSTVVFAATDKGTKIVYATADDGTNPNMVDTGISTNTLTGVTGDITVDSPADIILDADGADISLKDGGTLFGTLTNSGGELVIKSSSSGTTAATFSGANVTLAGTVGSGNITSTGTVQGTTITATTAFVPDASDGAALGTSALEFSDLFLADEAVINFGDDQEVTLTHVADAGLLLNSDNYLTFRDAALKIHSSADGQLDIDADTELEIATTTLDLNGALDVSGASQFSGAVTVGVDDTGLDVKFFGAAAGAYGLYDQSENAFEVRGATAAGAGLLKLTTGELTVVDADKLGRIDFQAPLEADGTDSVAIAASIWAEADDTFSTSVNNTDLVFALGKSEAAAEKFRFTADNEIGIAGANYGTDGQVLTSGGAGAAVAWEDASAGAVTQLNNATQNELVTIASTTTQLDAEANLTFTGSALTCIGTITTGIDDTGHDVKFFGATSGSFLLWDESDDALELTDSSPIKIGDGGDMTIYHDGTDSFVTNATGALKLATETSGIVVTIGHTTSETTVADNLTITGTTVGTTFDTNGTADAIILDANGNTTISSPTDDQIDFEIAGADDFTMTANTFTILSGSTIAIAAGGAITNAGTMAPDIVSSGKTVVFGF